MKTVLIVEDHADCAEPLAKMLGHSGYRALVAEDGHAALGFMQTLVPHLVVLDVMLPQMNGLEFLAAIRPLPAFAQLPVVAFTALGDHETHRKLTALGVRKVLRKGEADFDQVLRSVRLELGEDQPQRPTPAPPTPHVAPTSGSAAA